MKSRLVATGLTGTIGHHLPPQTEALRARLDGTLAAELEIPSESIVIHLAAVVGEHKVRSNLKYAESVNVSGAVELARLVQQSDAQRFVYVSTSHVYEINEQTPFLDEDSPTLPRGHYALQKLSAERLIAEVFRDDPNRLVIARVFSIIDRHQPAGTLGHSILQLPGNPQRQLGCADDVRDFLTPRIVADLLVRLGSNPEFFGTVNVCSGQGSSVRDVAKMLLSPDDYERAKDQVLSGNSASPRIVGAPRRIEEVLGLGVGSLYRSFCEELKEH